MNTVDTAALTVALEVLADAIAAKVVDRLRAGDVGMLDQSASPLGRRRHIAAVRRLVASGQPGAAILGRRYLLSKERLDAELGATGKKAPPIVDELAELRAKFEWRAA